MTIQYFYSRKKLLNYFNEKSTYYSEVEIGDAKSNPVILHFTPSFTSRPWVNDCKHPLKSYYWDILKMTPWCDAKPQKNNAKWYVRILDVVHRKL